MKVFPQKLKKNQKLPINDQCKKRQKGKVIPLQARCGLEGV